MRINRYVAQSTGLSRRGADLAVAEGRVAINGNKATIGQEVHKSDKVTLDERAITPAVNSLTIMLNKPAGYVVSRNGQGSKTIYDLLPKKYHNLKPIGRLDKDSSGLLLLTNDGKLAEKLTHPRFNKTKTYRVTLSGPLQPLHRQMISDYGIKLDDGLSRLILSRQADNNDKVWTVQMSEGRNRQIRRTFETLGYKVTKLHRTHFGNYSLGKLSTSQIKEV